MSGTIWADLERALGAGELVPASDTASWTVGDAVPLAVALPSSVEAVREVLLFAAAHGVGVVPLGARTDPGCEPPQGPFIVLGTERLTGIEDYEPADLTVTARAGTPLGDLGAALAAEGQWLPVDPPFAPRRTLGGLVATGAAGPLGTAYGAPRDHVLGLTAVSGDGRVLRLGGRVMKNVAGFDLVKLLVGSRGTLGVVVSASVRLFPRPEEDRLVLVSADRPGDLLGLARQVATGRVVPASATLVAGALGGRAQLVLRLQGAPAAVAADQASLLAKSEGARLVAPEDLPAELERTRDCAAGHPVVVRTAALPARLPELLDAVTAALPDAAIAADVLAGRVRCGVVTPSAVSPPALQLLRSRVEALGGTVTLAHAPAELVGAFPAFGGGGTSGALARALRERFDPQGVLSPGRFVH